MLLLVNCSKKDNENQRNNTMNKEVPVAMPPLTDKEINIVQKLSQEDINKIDIEILNQSSYSRRKTARIIGWTMRIFNNDFSNLPERFYLNRIIQLVKDGKLKAYGNLEFIRFSEVKLTGK